LVRNLISIWLFSVDMMCSLCQAATGLVITTVVGLFKFGKSQTDFYMAGYRFAIIPFMG